MDDDDGPKVALVVGASRGIGRQIAIDLAKNNYAVVVAGKTTGGGDDDGDDGAPDPNSPRSTIDTVAREIAAAGGAATAVRVDVRDPASVAALVATAAAAYGDDDGRLDAVVYNAGAVWWAAVEDTPLSRFRLLQDVNVHGLYATVQAALPHLRRRGRGRVVVVSPPIYSRFFRGKTAYAMGKVAMSVLTQGLAMDWERQGLHEMAITSLWPAVAIESAATAAMVRRNPEEARDLRKATIFSDAMLAVLRAPAASVNGRLALDEDFLRSDAGVTDFAPYAVVPGTEPRRIMPARLPDLTVAEQADEGKRMDSAAEKAKL